MATLINARDKALQTALYRSGATQVRLTAPAGAFIKPKNGAAITPASIKIKATANYVFTAAATYSWQYALSTAPDTYITLTDNDTPVTTDEVTLTGTTIAGLIGSASEIYYKCTVTEPKLDTASAIYKIIYSKESDDPITVNMTKTNVSVPCDQYGTPSSFAGTGTTITVVRGSTALGYNSLGGALANTFTVTTAADANRTLGGTGNSTAASYVLDDLTALVADQSSTIFTITVYDGNGTATNTFSRTLAYTKVKNGLIGANGVDATRYYLQLNTVVLAKSSSAADITGVHTPSTIIATGKSATGTNTPVNFGYVTITASTAANEAAVSQVTQSLAITNTSQATFYTVKLYNDAQKTVLLDTQTVPVVYTGTSGTSGTSAISLILTNDNVSVPTDSAGDNANYTSTGTDIIVFEGSTQLTYAATGTTPGTWKISNVAATNITAGSYVAKAGSTTTVTAAAPSAITADVASITYTITGITAAATAFTITKTQSLKKLKAGSIGINGNRSIVVNAYQWALTAPSVPAQAFTYTWATGVISAYPTGWASAAAAAPDNGYTLYQLNLTISDSPVNAITNANWSVSTLNIIGFRKDGSIGELSAYTKTAYITLTTATPPSTPAATTGADSLPAAVGGISWTSASPGTVPEGNYVYISTGIYGETSNKIVWAAPYLSYFKVGSLSAISASLGAVGVSTTGNIHSGTNVNDSKTFGDTKSGFFLGYDGSAYKMDVGSPSSYLRFDGTTVSATGMNIYTADNQDILTIAGGQEWIANSTGVKTWSAVSLQKTGTGTGLDAWAYSKQFYASGAAVSFQAVGSTSRLFEVGLKSSVSPGTDSTIDYGIVLSTNRNVVARVSGNTVSTMATSYSVNDQFLVAYDNKSVYYFINGVLKYTYSTSVPTGLSLVAKLAFTTPQAYATAVKFTPWSGVGADGINGTNGTNGINGEQGAAGTRAGVTYILSGYETWSGTAEAAVTSWFTTNYSGTVIGDRATVFNSATGKSETRSWTGTTWEKVSVYIDGNLLVSGTITSDALALNLVTVGQRIVSQDGLFVVDLQNKYISISV
jgi:hypothetical protein